MGTQEDPDVTRFLTDPGGYFDSSKTAIHSIDPARLRHLQRAGLSRRFQQHVEQIAMVGRLAERQGIRAIDDVTDVLPLLFEHTMYKSYPLALLQRQQFDKLTSWLQKLTSADLSGVDVSACDSIDSWLEALERDSELDVTYTSGTSGTMSFLPFSKRDYRAGWRINRLNALQRFGEPATREAVAGPYHFMVRANRLRGNDRTDQFTLGDDETYNHTCFPRPSADLTWLGARLRLAAARGDVSRVQVPDSLLARRDEMERLRAEEDAAIKGWLADIANQQGERIFWTAFPYDIYTIAAARAEAGERWSFATGSVLLMGGGAKGNALPGDWRATVERFIDSDTVQAYGMQEITTLQLECPAGHYHLNPWVIPFILDPDTSSLHPREGVRTGRLGLFDLLAESHWGGLLTGDAVTLYFDRPCECGATTQHIGPAIARLSDRRGGDDKITCTASPQAYDEAMRFLSGY